jgi:hypothetical protein
MMLPSLAKFSPHRNTSPQEHPVMELIRRLAGAGRLYR